jgi:excisionase family DNA binding protein
LLVEADVPNEKPVSIPRKGSLPYAAAKLNCCVPKARQLIDQGLLRAYKIGKHWKATDEQILKCVERLEDIAKGGRQ